MELEFWIGVEMQNGVLEDVVLFDNEEKAAEWTGSMLVGRIRQLMTRKYELDDDEVSDFARNALDMRHMDDTDPRF